MNAQELDAAETELARHLRALGMHRETAIIEAEQHTGRLAFDTAGLSIRLADGSVARGPFGLAALAREIAARFPDPGARRCSVMARVTNRSIAPSASRKRPPCSSQWRACVKYSGEAEPDRSMLHAAR